MSDIFTDLSGIRYKKLKVESVKHVTSIDVDEFGTKAAAVTTR